MDRIEASEAVAARLFGQDDGGVAGNDPELMAILRRHIFGDTFALGGLDDRTRELITIVLLATLQTLPQLRAHVGAALNVGVPAVEIREALYQGAVFLGFPRTLNAVSVANAVFAERGLELPLPAQGTVTEADRYEAGRAIQAPLYGDAMRTNLADVPDGLGVAMADLLTAHCFGDFYTRDGLDLPTRELLVLCMLVALGDMPVQVRSHALGNLRLGTSKSTLIAAMIHAAPYLGFPRAVNAVRIIKELDDPTT